MNIVFFVHCFFPSHFYGTETYTLELAKHYQSRGHRVTVVSAVFQGEPALGSPTDRYEFQGIPVVCFDKNLLPHTRVKETYYQPSMRPILEQVLMELEPDVVHVTHLINHTAVLLEVTQKLKIPTFATFTDFFGFCLNNKLEAASGALCDGPSPSRTNCLACHLKAAAPAAGASWMRHASSPVMAQALATTSNWARRLPYLRGKELDGLVEDIARRPETLAGLYNAGYRAAVAPTKFLRGAYERNGITVPLHSIQFGVDIDRAPKPKRDKAHLPVIGFIGQIAPHKGTDLLVEAFTRLPKNAAWLRIYGPDDQDPAYMQKLRSMAQGFNVTFEGTFEKERMAQILSTFDVMVIPSRWYENSPLVLLNALATHTPVLVSDVEGMTEFVQDGVNGHAFARGSADDLFLHLDRLVKPGSDLFFLAETTQYLRTPAMMADETFAIYQAYTPAESVPLGQPS